MDYKPQINDEVFTMCGGHIVKAKIISIDNSTHFQNYKCQFIQHVNGQTKLCLDLASSWFINSGEYFYCILQSFQAAQNYLQNTQIYQTNN
jgi:hypothetical protein